MKKCLSLIIIYNARSRSLPPRFHSPTHLFIFCLNEKIALIIFLFPFVELRVSRIPQWKLQYAFRTLLCGFEFYLIYRVTSPSLYLASETIACHKDILVILFVHEFDGRANLFSALDRLTGCVSPQIGISRSPDAELSCR